MRLGLIITDGGGEFCSKEFETFLEENGITHHVTNAGEPKQNGLAERYGRSLQEMSFAMLKHAKLPLIYWPYAFRSACYVLNRLTHSKVEESSPHEAWHGVKPKIDHLRTFGCDAFVKYLNPAKGQDKSRLCTFLGYQEGLKGYIFLDNKTRRIIKSGDAKFYEGDWNANGIERISDDIARTKEAIVNPIGGRIEDKRMAHQNDLNLTDSNEEEDELIVGNDTDDPERDDDGCSEHEEYSIARNRGRRSKQRNMEEPEQDDEGCSEHEEYSIARNRARRSKTNYELRAQVAAESDESIWSQILESGLMSTTIYDAKYGTVVIPQTYEEAMNGNHSTEWKIAMEDEVGSHQENRTWSKETIQPPKGRKVVKSRWIFSVKRDEGGKIVRFKARLVAKGYTQRRGIDYQDTFSPVMQPTVLRSLLAIGAEKDWEMEQVDIKTAFLYGELEEELYI